MSINTSAGDSSRWAGAENYYGGQDLARDLATMSNADIKAQMAANPGRFRDQSTIDRINALSSSGSSGSGGGGGGYSGGSIGAGAGAFNPGSVNFNPGGIDMGGDSGPSWSNDDFVAGLARERSQEYINNGTTTENNSITNDIEQNIGNKGDWETNIGDNNTINNSSIGNDYSLNLGSLNVANRIK